MKIRVSVIQMDPKLCDRKYNMAKIAHFVEEVIAHEKRMDLIILPELVTSGYECNEKFFELAEVFPAGASVKFISNLAKEHKTHIIFGFPEEDSNMEGILYNSAALIDDNGTPIGVYRKVHLFGQELYFFRPGWEYPLFRTRIGNIGIFICWDTLFPEVARIYALQGADLLAISTNWENPYSKEWDFITSARAFDNTLYLAAANRIGCDKTLSFFGRSRILDPLGSIICSLNEEKEGFLCAEIDFSKIRRLRVEYWTQLRDRRPETYGILTKKYDLPHP